MQLLCRNDVKDFDTWKQVFDADAEARRMAGLTQLQLWREAGNPNRVFLLFEVNDADKARAFLDAPQAPSHADRAGVISGECHLLETT